jgi:LmbE family N-acetylglucosaminyl deacetylase
MKPRRWITPALLLLIALSALQAGNRNTYQLPEERGTAGILAALQKLPVYVRVLHTTAHPDDESSGTLTWLSRRFHAKTALYCLTRGEGGQNILGNEKYEALGLVRTGELLEACRYYGVDLFFGNALDFGFSKTAEETLSKWGHETTLEEMVRFIRQWRPSIIISKFQGGPGDGHGHHQAAGMLTSEAFRAAADLNQFPGQLTGGLRPWQAKKLYISGMGGGPPPAAGADTVSAGWTVRIPVGDYDPVLGRSYREIASEGYSKHRTQGNGTALSLPGRSFEYFKLVDSVVGSNPKEDSLFDSMNTSLTAIFDLAGNEKAAVPFLQQDLAKATQAAAEALQAFQIARPEDSAAAAAKGAGVLTESLRKVESSSLSAPAKELLKDALNEKLVDYQKAVSASLGIRLIARSEEATGIPGATVPVTVYFYNRGMEGVNLNRVSFTAPGKAELVASATPFGWKAAGSATTIRYSVAISGDAKITEPFWYLENSHDARYRVRSTEDAFAPFKQPEIRAQAVYSFRNTEVPVDAVLEAQAGDSFRGSDFVDFQIVPALSVTLDPDFEIASVSSTAREYKFRVSVSNNQKGEARGTLKLVSGMKWLIQPAGALFALARKSETFTATFSVQVPAGARAGSYPIEAFAAMNGQEFSRTQHAISYPENWTRNLYDNARSKIEIFEIRTAPNLAVGYVPGAGDDIPAALERLGVKVQFLSAADLAFGDLNRFSAIVTGIRAYNVNEELRANNRRLMDYVAQGGTLIVQYVRPMDRPARGTVGSSFTLGPYPMSVSDSDRITVEDSPMRILDPGNRIFNQPNKITAADFQGWVQERGLYFMNTWDPHYKALLSGNDPGEEPKNGGMLLTQYGKGYYIYTAYAWFRQLPAGVPGAFRIFANMISLGRPSNK